MKRFLVFAGDHYYPSGGVNDLVGDFATKEEATTEATKKHTYPDGSGSWSYADRDHWYQIVDYDTMKAID